MGGGGRPGLARMPTPPPPPGSQSNGLCVLRSNTGLSKHGDPVFPPFCPLDQNLARVRTGYLQWGTPTKKGPHAFMD